MYTPIINYSSSAAPAEAPSCPRKDCEVQKKEAVAAILTDTSSIDGVRNRVPEQIHELFMEQHGLSSFRPAVEPSTVRESVIGALTRCCTAAKLPHRQRKEYCRKINSLKMLEGKKAIKTLIELRTFFGSCDGFFSEKLREHIQAEASRIKKTISEVTIGSALIYPQNEKEAPVTMVIKKTIGSFDSWTLPATVFKAYHPETNALLGKCKFRIENGFPECIDKSYHNQPVVGILRLDSFARDSYRLIGTELMEAAQEYGITKLANRRIVLHSEASAMGFYYKLGMRSGNEVFDQHVIKGDISLDPEDAFFLYLPPSGIPQWESRVVRPVLFTK